jgi:hypothetical protein
MDYETLLKVCGGNAGAAIAAAMTVGGWFPRFTIDPDPEGPGTGSDIRFGVNGQTVLFHIAASAADTTQAIITKWDEYGLKRVVLTSESADGGPFEQLMELVEQLASPQTEFPE